MKRLVLWVFLLSFALGARGLPPVDQTPVRTPGLQIMPPHPSLLEQARLGKITLPESITDPEYRQQLGIDQPNPLAIQTPASTWKTIALLVKFTDKSNLVSATYFDSLLFGASQGQMNHYYKAVSYNQLDIVTVNLPSSIGWNTMPQTLAYYVANGYCYEAAYPRNCQKLAEDAVAAANAVVDFSQYDNDGDGYVDTVFIIHAGKGAEITNSPTDIWSHSWQTYNQPYVDGVRVSSYTTEPEYWFSANDMTIGVYAHELGHALGLPDLYDTDYTPKGVGDWSLMSGGSWNGQYGLGESPAFLDAWSRYKLGWVTPIAVSGTLTAASIPAAETSPTIYKLKSARLGSEEYFLVENRQITSYDAYLDGSGLLIWHIDENVDNNDKECKQVNNWNCASTSQHFQVALEQADGALNLEKNNTDGDGGDPWPGTSGKRAFNSASMPNTSSYYYSTSADTNLSVTNISNSSSTMTADFYVAGAPGAFNKTNPTIGATGVSISPTLTWGTSAGATSYEYCYDTSNDSSCSTWLTNGTSTSKALSGLAYNTTYYWHVRAKNSIGTTYSNDNTWWSFVTQVAPPGAFNKSSPANSVAGQPISLTLAWESSSGATSYEYCYDTSNHNNCAAWQSNGSSQSKAISGLAYSTTYYWQVRAKNASPTITEANGGLWWSFTTQSGPPAAFSKTSPSDAATGLPTGPTLSWAPSSGATEYEYCYDTDDNNACDDIWTDVDSATSTTLSGLGEGNTYYWQVRAKNAQGTTAANSGDWWSFTIHSGLPGDFSKSNPANGAPNVPTTTNLYWSSADGANTYEYCYDTNDNDACDSGWYSGQLSSAMISGLFHETTYYWQVRAVNSHGDTEANSGDWWSFTTMGETAYLFLPMLTQGDHIQPANVINGDFESGREAGWSEASTYNPMIVVSAPTLQIAAHSGGWAAWLGRENNEISRLWQQVTVPATQPYLHFWTWVISNDICGYDYGYFQVNGTNLTTYYLCSNQATSGWVEKVVDLSFFAGQSITLQFRVETDGSIKSHFYLDDVSFSNLATVGEQSASDQSISEKSISNQVIRDLKAGEE
ncbi:MAG: M6 family metalloprotease domain-containing protein [Anaerolineales bacterium]|nr:M6 family metalloprotease domain-containing protein [Anaerolineales bacterium]